MSPHELTVFIVDDDPSVRDALSLLLAVRGYRTAVFASAEGFLQAWKSSWTGCLLIDLRMPGMDGLALQTHLNELECLLPIIVITGHGDASVARQAFKANAHDFFEKPIDDEALIAAINEAFARETKHRNALSERARSQQELGKLTPREREVMQHVVSGRHNREIAEKLDISVRTVEVHKTRLMSKLGISNVVDLVKISMSSKDQGA
ncbi:response regulator transcription factor [Viridibacterium curvum]|uniref:Oxygen response regulator transcription factor FixJ n=1 Tax=Viridibacterium curvum TaxID=1101404 RepID=A0ABP9QH51_9RHOO